MKLLTAAIVAVLLSSAGAHADVQLMAMQLRLKVEGFYTSEVDGRRGPGTSAAMKRYAEAHGIPNDRSRILRHLYDTAEAARVDPTPELSAEAITAVKEILADPYSADVQPMFAFAASSNSSVVCGRFNAKNRYGAYVGFDWFYVIIFDAITAKVPIGEPLTGADAMEFCMMGASMTPSAPQP